MHPLQLTEEEWQSWLAHPVTALWRQYLLDRQLANARDWANGARLSELEQGAAMACGLLHDVDYEQFMTFYKEQSGGETQPEDR